MRLSNSGTFGTLRADLARNRQILHQVTRCRPRSTALPQTKTPQATPRLEDPGSEPGVAGEPLRRAWATGAEVRNDRTAHCCRTDAPRTNVQMITDAMLLVLFFSLGHWFPRRWPGTMVKVRRKSCTRQKGQGCTNLGGAAGLYCSALRTSHAAERDPRDRWDHRDPRDRRDRRAYLYDSALGQPHAGTAGTSLTPQLGLQADPDATPGADGGPPSLPSESAPLPV